MSGVSFNIVENYNHEDKYPRFKEDLLKGELTRREIQVKYSIGRSTFQSWKQRVMDETGVVLNMGHGKYKKTKISS